jgi:hypothetical protein
MGTRSIATIGRGRGAESVTLSWACRDAWACFCSRAAGARSQLSALGTKSLPLVRRRARSPPSGFTWSSPIARCAGGRPLAWTEIEWHPDRPFQPARANVMQSAFVPGSMVNTSASPVDRSCFSDILGAPLAPVGSTTTTPLTPAIAAPCSYKDALLPPWSCGRVCCGIQRPIARWSTPSRRAPSSPSGAPQQSPFFPPPLPAHPQSEDE